MRRHFIALLFLTSLTGLALLAWRDGRAMAPLLAAHLGVVMALFGKEISLVLGTTSPAACRMAPTARIPQD